MTIDGTSESAPIAVVVGTTTFTGRALQRLATGIAGDAARVSARDVSARLSDERGALRVSLTVPVALSAERGGTIVDDGDALRRTVIERMRELCGRTVAVVDIRYSGVRRLAERRVR
ncbi:hypothetical protein [Microbacterium sp. SA39]|uniref:hypothetical protein n=1 Tax=Microbacterium sp. SA39 TaxID=1263625 RepID=UPI0005F9CCD1|nr:hypothetical protein [Microbacterium sp. SA39]KJQ55118.1 hypothetical protein RS85_01178 [Microbacterium sp. SA39]